MVITILYKNNNIFFVIRRYWRNRFSYCSIYRFCLSVISLCRCFCCCIGINKNVIISKFYKIIVLICLNAWFACKYNLYFISSVCKRNFSRYAFVCSCFLWCKFTAVYSNADISCLIIWELNICISFCNSIIWLFGNFNSCCLWAKHILTRMALCCHNRNRWWWITLIICSNSRNLVEIRYFIFCRSIRIWKTCSCSNLCIAIISALWAVNLITYGFCNCFPRNCVWSISRFCTNRRWLHRKNIFNTLWFYWISNSFSADTCNSELIRTWFWRLVCVWCICCCVKFCICTVIFWNFNTVFTVNLCTLTCPWYTYRWTVIWYNRRFNSRNRRCCSCVFIEIFLVIQNLSACVFCNPVRNFHIGTDYRKSVLYGIICGKSHVSPLKFFWRLVCFFSCRIYKKRFLKTFKFCLVSFCCSCKCHIIFIISNNFILRWTVSGISSWFRPITWKCICSNTWIISPETEWCKRITSACLKCSDKYTCCLTCLSCYWIICHFQSHRHWCERIILR